MNQLEVRRGLAHLGIATPQSQEKWVEENIERGAKREPQAVEFTVYDCTDSTPVGTAGLFRKQRNRAVMAQRQLPRTPILTEQ
jgi:hypothetical protein